jgi:uncharacterized protein
MMNAKSILSICILFLLVSCSQPTKQPIEATSSGTPDMPNPASVYCEQQGYKLEIRTASDGSQSGVCVFPDGSECDEWAYYRRECTPATQDAFMPNPASVYCEQRGYKVEIRNASDGSQSGVCIFPDGSECDEWAFFRGECKPPTPTPEIELGWQTYTNQALGYSFSYPAGVEIITNDEPLKSLSISGAGIGNAFWGIAHPIDRPEYRPSEGVDLLQWLKDHYLVGENQQPDAQIAGETAIHFRHEASPQSSTFDQYYFAHDGQLYQIIIGNANLEEDWNLANHFMQSFQFITPTSPDTGALPTALPIDPSVYTDWITYTNPTYGFTLKLPGGWVVDEADSSDPLLVGHEIILENTVAFTEESIRLTFRRVGEDTFLWPSGVGEGEFIQQGTLEISGQPALRMLLVCPNRTVTAIWYYQTDSQADGQPNITLGDIEFVIIFRMPGHCEPGYNLTGELQQMGEAIIASLKVP